MKTAVVFYSMHGNVRYVSEKVAKELGADLIELVPVKAYPDKGAMQFIWGGSAVTFKKKPELEPYTFNASDYDLVIIGTPVWASNFTPPLRTFFENNDLTGKKIAVIATSAGGDSAKCVEAVKAAAGADSLAAVLSLVDPKEKPSDENEKQIAAFIDTCKGL
ncbi:MAG: NAD(P)H-dependent oxidoreductase [Saccharofermentans sp.]|nr:NAD(P)H-dependent oxidoreductase [Saccharofermentans sp.]